MQINTTARHCDLDPEVRAFAQHRLAKFGRFVRDIHEVHLTVTGEKFRTTAEIVLRLNHHELVSREEADEVKMAIDQAADGIENQLRRFKDKRSHKSRRGRGADGPESGAGPDGEGPEEDSA